MKTPRYRLPIRAWNAVAPRTRLDAGALIDAAIKQSGLRDFGDESWRPAFDRLVQAVEQEARLHAWGRFITRQRLVGVLKNRLRAQALFRAHPEILEQELAPLLVVTGLQRTGTTFLQRLLAADPGAMSLLSWEALNPAPLPRKHEQRKRIAVARTAERVLRYMAPEFFAIHPVAHTAPEEEVLLLDAAFSSTVPEATMLVPEYSAWLARQDQEPAYRYMRKLLLLLQWQKRGGRHWVLKTPHHMEWLDVLVRVFPGVRIIHTHRDPLRNLASFLSMAFHAMRIFSAEVTPAEVGAFWTKKITSMVERAMAFRDASEGAGITDVIFYDLVKQPMAAVERIYRDSSRVLGDEARRLMQEQCDRSRATQHAVHTYRLEDFGVDRAEADAGFAAYRARFQLPYEDRADGEHAIPQHLGLHPGSHQAAIRQTEADRQP